MVFRFSQWRVVFYTAENAPSKCICYILFSTDMVMRAIKEMQSNVENGGSGGFSPVIIKTCSRTSPYVHLHFSFILRQCSKPNRPQVFCASC